MKYGKIILKDELHFYYTIGEITYFGLQGGNRIDIIPRPLCTKDSFRVLITLIPPKYYFHTDDVNKYLVVFIDAVNEFHTSISSNKLNELIN